MFKIKLADLTIEIDNKHTYIEEQCAGYITDGDAYFRVSLSDEQIAAEADGATESAGTDMSFHSGYLESLAVYRAIAEKLPEYDGFLLHSAVIDVDDRGIAFAARSGTGKTTHIRLWRNLLGDKCAIINGDKPLIRFIEGKPYAYGTPWAGKEGYNINSRVQLLDICFLDRAEENSIAPISAGESVKRLFCQIYMPKNPLKKVKTLELMDSLMKNVRVWKIGCNMDISAAETVYNKIFEVRRNEG